MQHCIISSKFCRLPLMCNGEWWLVLDPQLVHDLLITTSITTMLGSVCSMERIPSWKHQGKFSSWTELNSNVATNMKEELLERWKKSSLLGRDIIWLCLMSVWCVSSLCIPQNLPNCKVSVCWTDNYTLFFSPCMAHPSILSYSILCGVKFASTISSYFIYVINFRHDILNFPKFTHHVLKINAFTRGIIITFFIAHICSSNGASRTARAKASTRGRNTRSADSGKKGNQNPKIHVFFQDEIWWNYGWLICWYEDDLHSWVASSKTI